MTTRERKQEVSPTQTITPELLQKWLSPNDRNGFTLYEAWLKTQTDPLATLDALKIAYNFKLIKLPQLARAIGSIGLHARQHGFRHAVLDLTFKQSAPWKEWLAWMERTLIAATEFPPPSAHQLLAGLAALTENYYVIRPFKAEAINKLVTGLKTCGSLEEIRDGLNDLRALVDYQGVQNIAALDVNTFSDLLSYTPQQKKEKKSGDQDAKTSRSAKKIPEIVTRTQIARSIAHIISQINAVSSSPKCIQIQSLINVLDQALKSRDKSAANLSLLLLAIGKLLQAGRQQGENETLQKKITEILDFLNEENTAAKMSVSHLAAAVHALVLPAPPGWCNLKPTKNLVKQLLKRLDEKPSPTATEKELVARQRDRKITLQQLAEYLLPDTSNTIATPCHRAPEK